MADVVDTASEHDFSEERLRALRAQKQKPILRGLCLYCEAKVTNLFCDMDCKESYEAEELIRKRTGRK